ncbi:MAG TPA: polyphosphate kinase 1 [Candidatus Limnocylindrales bacterium]|nr:polyphosphate kinase 1 [Candidatus Limnocylindrales bacterium]
MIDQPETAENMPGKGLMSTPNAHSDVKAVLSQKKFLDNPSYFINRELSWIRFNMRVLEEAQDLGHPLLERVKFIAICGSNLDEFFMTRIPRLMKKINAGSSEKSMDGMTAIEQVETTRKEIIPLIEKHADCWRNELLPALAKAKIFIWEFNDLGVTDKENLRNFFKQSILPFVKTREGFDSTFIENLHVTLCVTGFAKQDEFYMVDVPTEEFGRLIRIPKSLYSQEVEYNFVFVEDLIINNLNLIFPNEKNLTAFQFRLTRNGEIAILIDESADLLYSVKKSLSSRKTGFPSRLEFERNVPAVIKERIATALGVPDYLTYEFDGPLGLVDLWQMLKINRPNLKDKSFRPCVSPLLTPEKDMFAAITRQDFVLYHPYDSFEVIINLLREAARDSDVLEICITMYRMDHKSPVVDALIEAAEKGKKVTAIIELKAKFDEENNIRLVSKLREGGINTVYNFPNFKVHAKLCLIVRKENGKIARYSHIGSGNYNSVTAKIYADIGYLTGNPEVGAELEELFNIIVNGLQEKEFKHLLVAPKTLKNEILERIEKEIDFHQKTGKGYMAFKLNNLEETEIIQALYRASMAGIKVDLNVRGLCCLRPGIKGVSDNISVISIVGRFLEHARIYYFQGETEDEVLTGSSDMMFRNLNERIEVLLTVPDPYLRRALVKDILKIHLRDNVKARRLLSDGTYERVTHKEGEKVINSQAWLIKNRGIWNVRPG